MIRNASLTFVFVAMLLLSVSIDADDTEVRMAVTEWAPYTGENLPDQGISTAVIRKVFARAGYKLVVDFSPWQRTQTSLFQTTKYIGTFPIYDSFLRRSECLYSVAFGQSPVGFVQQIKNPVSWQTFDDLKTARIGTVMGYSNTEKFDALAASGSLDVSSVPTDVMNIRRLVFNRIDLAVMDKFVMRYLLANNEELKPYQAQLEFNDRPLGNPKHYICFARTEEALALQQVFDRFFDPEEAAEISKQALLQLGADK